MKMSSLRPLLCLCLLTFYYSAAYAVDVLITETNGSTNGNFVGNTWTPSGGPSILDFSELLAQLAIGDVIISTNGPGNITFQGANFSTSTGYDLSVDRLLTLEAAGDIIIEKSGVHPALPANIGKLHININSSVDGDLIVRGAGLRTNGGDLNITGVDNVYQYGSGIFTNGGMSSGKLTFKGKVFKLGFEEDGSINGGDMAVGQFDLEVDTAAFNSFDLLVHGALDIEAKVSSFQNGTIRYGGATGISGETFTIDADSTFARAIHFDWKEDITIDSKHLCLVLFRIGDTTLNHQTDIFVKAEELLLNEGNFNLRNGSGVRTMDFDVSKVAKFDGIRSVISRGNGNVNISAADSLIFYACTKGADAGQGNVIGIQEGDGSVFVQSDYLYMQYTDAGIRLGHGSIHITADERAEIGYSVITIIGDEAPQTATDTISINTKVLRYGRSNVSIKRSEDLDNLVHIVATDSLLADEHLFGKDMLISDGGFIGFGDEEDSGSIFYFDGIGDRFADEQKVEIDLSFQEAIANGNINIESSWISSNLLHIAQMGGIGQVKIEGEIFKLSRGGIIASKGGIELNIQDSIDGEFFHFQVDSMAADDENDIIINSRVICMEDFSIKTQDADINGDSNDNLTDIFLNAEEATLQKGVVGIRSLTDDRRIDFLVNENLKMDRISVEVLDADGDIHFSAGDSLLIGSKIKGDTEVIGNSIYVRNGIGRLIYEAKVIYMQQTASQINLGHGDIFFKAEESIGLISSSIGINKGTSFSASDIFPQDNPDTISFDSRVMHIAKTQTDLVNKSLLPDNAILINAVDTLDTRVRSYPCFGNGIPVSGGGFLMGDEITGNIIVNAQYIGLASSKLQNNGIGDVLAAGGNFNLNNGGVQVDTGQIKLLFTDSITLEEANLEIIGVGDDNDIYIKAKEICTEMSSIKNEQNNNTTDILVEGENAAFKTTNFDIENGVDGRSIRYLLDKSLKFSESSALILGSGGAIELIAEDSILTGTKLKGQTEGSVGNAIQVLGGIGKIKVATDYYYMQNTALKVEDSEGGTIDIDATEKMESIANSIRVSNNNATQSAADTLSIKTKVLLCALTPIQIAFAEESENNFLEIIAADTLDFGKRIYPCYDEVEPASGGAVMLDRGSAGKVNIETGWMNAHQMFIGNNFTEGTSDLYISAADSLIMDESSFVNTAQDGVLKVKVGSSIYMKNSALVRGPGGTGTYYLNGGGDLLMEEATIGNRVDGDMLVDIVGDIRGNNLVFENKETTGYLTLRARKLDIKDAGVFLIDSDEPLKVQVDDIDAQNSQFGAFDGASDLILAGKTFDLTEGRAGTDGGEVFLTFVNDINLTESNLRSRGGNMKIISVEGAVNSSNGNDINAVDGENDGIFTGEESTQGGDLMITACTGISIDSDLSTVSGNGGTYTEIGSPISSLEERIFEGAGNIMLAINPSCTMLEVAIEDPCDCDNPENIFDVLDIQFFKEEVRITGAEGDIWVLDQLTAGAIFDDNGNEITNLSSLAPILEPNGEMVDYIFSFWHAPGIGYSASFEATAGPSIGLLQNISNVCEAEPCMRSPEDIPLTSYWGLLFMAILVLSIGIYIVLSLRA